MTSGGHDDPRSPGRRGRSSRAEEPSSDKGVGTANAHFGLVHRGDAKTTSRSCWRPTGLARSSCRERCSSRRLAEPLFKQSDKLLVVDHVLPERIANRRALYPEATRSRGAREDRGRRLRGRRDSTSPSARQAPWRTHSPASRQLRRGSGADPSNPPSIRRHRSGAHRVPGDRRGCRPRPEPRTWGVTSPPIRGSRHRGRAVERSRYRDDKMLLFERTFSHQEVRPRIAPIQTPIPGMPAIDVLLPLLLDRARTNGNSLSDVAALVAERPARAFGIARKGRLETGYDGDLVLVDLDRSRTIGADAAVSPSCGWSPWEGRQLSGWPTTTVLLGEVVARDGQLLPRGRAWAARSDLHGTRGGRRRRLHRSRPKRRIPPFPVRSSPRRRSAPAARGGPDRCGWPPCHAVAQWEGRPDPTLPKAIQARRRPTSRRGGGAPGAPSSSRARRPISVRGVQKPPRATVPAPRIRTRRDGATTSARSSLHGSQRPLDRTTTRPPRASRARDLR